MAKHIYIHDAPRVPALGSKVRWTEYHAHAGGDVDFEMVVSDIGEKHGSTVVMGPTKASKEGKPLPEYSGNTWRYVEDIH